MQVTMIMRIQREEEHNTGNGGWKKKDQRFSCSI